MALGQVRPAPLDGGTDGRLRLVRGPDGRQHAAGVLLGGVTPIPVHAPDDEPAPVDTHRPRRGHVDLRPGFGPVRDQGAMGSCVGFGFSALADYIAGARRATASPQALWSEGRRREGSFPHNVGIGMQDAANVVNGLGNFPEPVLPYPEGIQRRDPGFGPALARAAGPGQYEALGRRPARRVVALTASDQLWAALDLGVPVVIGMFEPSQFDFPGPGGRVDCPGTLVDTDSAHCVIVVGYDDPSRRLIVRNSWGPAWGDRGYCYLDYGYIEQGYVFQAFTAL
jgi:hypothetical protein